MKIIGIDPGKTGAIFFFETEPDDPRYPGTRWFAHTNDYKPWKVLRIPLIVPPTILTLKLDSKGKRKKKQPKSIIDWDQLAQDFHDVVRGRNGGPIFHKGDVYAYLERVTGSQGMGAQTGSFNFGAIYGFLRGLLAGENIPYTLVRPQDWKAALGIVSKPTEKAKKTKVKAPKLKKGEKKPPVRATEDKHVSRKLASKLFPGAAGEWALAKDDGVAEAACIAQYGMTQQGTDL